MTKESDQGLKISRNGENEEKSSSAKKVEIEIRGSDSVCCTSLSAISESGSGIGAVSVNVKLKSPSLKGKENRENLGLETAKAKNQNQNQKKDKKLNLSGTDGNSNSGKRSTENLDNLENIDNSDNTEKGEKSKVPSGSKISKTSPGQGPAGLEGGGSGGSDSPEIGEPMGLPSEHLLVPNIPSTNGHDSNSSSSAKNGLKRQNSGRQKCRCWCCCCSCSCLALKNCEPKGKDAESAICDSDDPPPNLEEIRSWGESFDKLMRSSGGRKIFRDFLKCEYSEENILFWLACEELKKERSPEAIEEKARLIYEDYISILSPKEVSLDSRVRDVVNQNMRNPKPSTFDEAQLQIYTLMHRDSYPRFVNSPLYKKLAQLNSTPPAGTPSGNAPSALGAGSHRGSTISATSPASRKQSAAS